MTTALTPDQVMASLNQAFAWYRQARGVTHSAGGAVGSTFSRDAAETARPILKRAFDVAHAQAAVLAQSGQAVSGPQPSSGRAEERARIQAAIQQEEQDSARLRRRLRAASGRTRQVLQAESAAANDRLELDRARLDFVTKLEQFDASLPGARADLEHQIQALQDAVPELSSATGASESTSAAATAEPTGTWALIHRLLGLQRSRGSLEELAIATSALGRTVENERRATLGAITPAMTRLRALASDPGAAGGVDQGQREFHDLLARAKLSTAVILALRQESELVHRYAADLQSWQRAIDGDARHVLQALAIELVGVAVALAVILVGSVFWRVAVVRYVTETYRRRLLLTIRNVSVAVAVALVLIFHFTSELTALVTVLGFAAAGIAFALQNVILAVVGYFAIVAPNGIRVGDRVSLQGPFAFVHGEVAEIGFVRIKLHELAGEPLRPTGRIVSFPNSVVFTGSFFKHPATEAH